MSRVVAHLKVCLANTYGVYLKTQNYHWNVKGTNFFSVHGFLEEMYKDLSESVDEMAERIVTLGDRAPGSFQEFQSLMTIAEASDERLTAPEMLEDLMDSFNVTLETLKGALDCANDEGDVGSEDFLASFIGEIEKKIWMIRAHLA
tara:strand:+ start:207 stop:644 length:438 start_codon:yes stop_codon:yes gene_type:complete